MPSILWSAPVPPAAKHPHNMMLPPPCFTVGMASACKPSPFSSKHNDGHYGLTVLFLFHQTRGHFSKKYDLCTCHTISRRQNASPSWVVWRLSGPMVFILAYYCLYKWTWNLQAFGNCSQGWTRLVEVNNCFLRSWLISFDFPMMSSKEALRSEEHTSELQSL